MFRSNKAIRTRLICSQKGGTDLTEVLIIVALLALGLVGAITIFGDSFEQQTDEVGDAVTRLEGLNGNGSSNHSTGNASPTSSSVAQAIAGPNGTQGPNGNGFTSTTAADVAVVSNAVLTGVGITDASTGAATAALTASSQTGLSNASTTSAINTGVQTNSISAAGSGGSIGAADNVADNPLGARTPTPTSANSSAIQSTPSNGVTTLTQAQINNLCSMGYQNLCQAHQASLDNGTPLSLNLSGATPGTLEDIPGLTSIPGGDNTVNSPASSSGEIYIQDPNGNTMLLDPSFYDTASTEDIIAVSYHATMSILDPYLGDLSPEELHDLIREVRSGPQPHECRPSSYTVPSHGNCSWVSDEDQGECRRNRGCELNRELRNEWRDLSLEERLARVGLDIPPGVWNEAMVHGVPFLFNYTPPRCQGALGVVCDVFQPINSALDSVGRWTNENFMTIVAIGATIACGGNPTCGAVVGGMTGATNAAIAGGDFGDILLGGITGAGLSTIPIGEVGGIPITLNVGEEPGIGIGPLNISEDGFDVNVPISDNLTLNISEDAIALDYETDSGINASGSTNGDFDLNYENEAGTLNTGINGNLETGDIEASIGNENTQLSLNQDGVLTGEVTVNGVAISGNSEGDYNVNLPISDFGNIQLNQNGLSGDFNLGEMGSISISENGISGQFYIGDNLSLGLDDQGNVTGSLNLGDLGQINVDADGGVSGSLGIGGVANLDFDADGNLFGSITTEHGTLNINPDGTISGELITENGTLAVDENGQASFTPPPVPVDEIFAQNDNADELAASPIGEDISMTNEGMSCGGNSTQASSGHALGSLPLALIHATSIQGLQNIGNGGGAMCPTANGGNNNGVTTDATYDPFAGTPFGDDDGDGISNASEDDYKPYEYMEDTDGYGGADNQQSILTFDRNRNGEPDVYDDHDGDGVPNYLDQDFPLVDAYRETASGGDGDAVMAVLTGAAEFATILPGIGEAIELTQLAIAVRNDDQSAIATALLGLGINGGMKVIGKAGEQLLSSLGGRLLRRNTPTAITTTPLANPPTPNPTITQRAQNLASNARTMLGQSTQDAVSNRIADVIGVSATGTRELVEKLEAGDLAGVAGVIGDEILRAVGPEFVEQMKTGNESWDDFISVVQNDIAYYGHINQESIERIAAGYFAGELAEQFQVRGERGEKLVSQILLDGMQGEVNIAAVKAFTVDQSVRIAHELNEMTNFTTTVSNHLGGIEGIKNLFSEVTAKALTDNPGNEVAAQAQVDQFKAILATGNPMQINDVIASVTGSSPGIVVAAQ